MSDPTTVYNWLRLDARVTTSGQPKEEELTAIRDLGVKHVVNLGLHTHEKALKDEAGSCVKLGMRYTHLPVDFKNPTEDDFARFCAILDALKDETVHVHCIANYRVTAFFYRYRREVLKWNEAEARTCMDAIWKPDGVWADFIAS